MDKNKLINRIENIGFLLGCFIGLLTLMMLGAEPTTMWTWVWSVVTLIGLIVVRSFIKKSLTK